MYNHNRTQVYTQISIESGVMGASPHQLITLLFDGALNALLRARILMNQGNIAGKGEAISKAINIIDNGLKNGLNHAQGGEIADNLAALYDYMKRRLMQGNLHNDMAAIDEVIKLLESIADAWRQIGQTYQPSKEVV
ncbi:flagellar protein FliS [Chania multitudinisentens RB-25]|uniref:Flagellar secretion chaperone FliS n=1 Tax=Chania multitudinisentens RB-25 TaxID=1441930 RepID=W0LHZ7_9GAMM|nr:flagellar export chaperone FliS [Chania multitudinisentens]AHG22069.1 flagellar protein FliS [Chania multitudinisentens RB-25]